MKPAAIIFDMDGVLIDSQEAHYQSWRALAAKYGIDLQHDQFLQTFGLQNRDVIPRLLGGRYTPEQIHELGELKEELYRQVARGQLRFIEGAVDLIRACRRVGLLLAVGSSGHPENIEMALDEMGVTDCFAAIVNGADVRRGKPEPDVFLLAAERLGVAPHACVVIEDAPAGIEAALRAGMIAIGLTTTHQAAELQAAHRVVKRLSDLDPQNWSISRA
jgi:beta-phosphoglucomutase